MATISVSWSILKAATVDKNIKLQFFETNNSYFIYAINGVLVFETRLKITSPPSSDQTDFETNFKNDAMTNSPVGIKITESLPRFYTLVEKQSANITFEGRSFIQRAPRDQPIWQVRRIAKVGSITETECADDGKFTQIWDDRVSLFPVPPFIDVLSTNFDGINDHLNGGDIFKFDNANAFTISMWIKPDNLSAQRCLYSKTTLDANVFGIGLYHNDAGKLFLQMRASGQLTSHTGGIDLTASVWQHVVLTYSGNQNINGSLFYVNAVADTTPASANITNTLLFGDDALFGRRGVAFHYSGNMNEVSIWNKQLSASEVATLYNDGSPQDVEGVSFNSNLVSFYKMGDGDIHPTILDNVGSSDLTMINMEEEDFEEDVP